MNTDVRLYVGFWQHPKTKKMVKRLGLEGVRSLQILWLWVTQNRPDGNLTGLDWEDIELAADWQGEERAFFDYCLGTWIDETEDGLYVHDWEQHNPWQSGSEERSNKARKAAAARWGNKDKNEQCTEHSQANAKPCQSNATSINEHKLEQCTEHSQAMPLSSPLQLKGIKNLNTPDYEGKENHLTPADTSADEFSSPLPDLGFDEPGLEFLELRQFYDENVRTEGPRAGFDEYKRLRASRDRTGHSRWPGINRIKDDLTARMEAGVWGKGFAIGLARYLTEQTWMAKIVPRAAPEDQSWEARESAKNNAAFLAKYGGINPDGTPIAKLTNSVAQACAM